MRKKRELLSEYQPTAGVNSDFEQLLQQFTSTETVRFEHFAEIWREMKMNFIFAGRDSERECREFTEGIMKMALKYLLPPYNFQVRVGGLYLLYGLFYEQPLIRKVRIRVTPEIWDQIVEFQSEARRQQHLDVNYIFQKLRADDGFLYSATEDEIFFNLNTTATAIKDTESLEEFKDEQTVLYDLFSDQFLQQLTQLHEHYHNVKVGLEGPNATEPSRSLNVIQTDIVPNIYETVMMYQNRKKNVKKGTTDTDNDMNDEDYNPRGSGNKSIKSRLKAKAFRNVAKAHRSRRHRQAVDSADETIDKPSHDQSNDNHKSPSSKKKGRKKKIKQELGDSEDAGIEEQNRSSLDDDGQGEVTRKELYNMPLIAEDDKALTPPVKKRPGRPRLKQKEDLNTPDKKTPGRPRLKQAEDPTSPVNDCSTNESVQNNDLKNVKTLVAEEKKSSDGSMKEEKSIGEESSTILHMPSFGDNEEDLPVIKKTPGLGRKRKNVKGKMPTVKLSPLKKKK